MKRKKQFGHLKPSVFQAFQEGKTPSEIIEFFGIPKSTVYDWQTEFRKSQKQEEKKTSTPKVSEKSMKPVPVEVLEPPRLKVLEGGKSDEELSDFELARSVLRSMALNTEIRDASRIQASLALARLVQMKSELPKHVLDGEEVSTLEQERKKLEGLSAEELARLYKEELEQTRPL